MAGIGGAAPQILSREGGAAIAYRQTLGKSRGKSRGKVPGVVFLTCFMSDMEGAKALALEAYCRAEGRAFIRFDYQGHGESPGFWGPPPPRTLPRIWSSAN